MNQLIKFLQENGYDVVNETLNCSNFEKFLELQNSIFNDRNKIIYIERNKENRALFNPTILGVDDYPGNTLFLHKDKYFVLFPFYELTKNICNSVLDNLNQSF